MAIIKSMLKNKPGSGKWGAQGKGAARGNGNGGAGLYQGKGGGGHSGGGARHASIAASSRRVGTQALLHEWVQAKRDRDFQTADRIREDLRAQGINPEDGHNGGGKGGGKGGVLRNFATEVKVWVGGLPEGNTGTELNKALKDHMAQAGNCQYAEIGKKGSGGAAFATADEAIMAITMLNGTEFAGGVIELDVWTKKEGDGPGAPFPMSFKKPDRSQGQKGRGKMSINGRGKRGVLRSFATEVKVWVGGLPTDSTGPDINKALVEHMSQAGDCRYAEIGKKGSGGAAFSTADEAINAITMFNGTEFAGVVIEVDVWTEKEKE